MLSPGLALAALTVGVVARMYREGRLSAAQVSQALASFVGLGVA